MAQAMIAAQVIGTVLSASGQLEAGNASRAQSQYQAAQLRRNAIQEQAVGSVQAQEEVRRMELTQSRILAVAGASGAGALDPTVVKLIAQTEAEGRLAAATRIYNSDTSAQAMTEQASATEYEGLMVQRASQYKVASTLLSGGKSIYDTYAGSSTAGARPAEKAPIAPRDYSLSSGGSSIGARPGGSISGITPPAGFNLRGY